MNTCKLDNGLWAVTTNQISRHGSPVAGLQELIPGTTSKIGIAVYLTPDMEVARAYAERRWRPGAQRVVYETRVPGKRFANMDDKQLLRDLQPVFLRYLDHQKAARDASEAWRSQDYDKAMQALREGFFAPGALPLVTEPVSFAFTRFMRTQGFDGVRAVMVNDEGMPPYDCLAVFDAVRVIKEKRLC
jgi:hypothetical protein